MGHQVCVQVALTHGHAESTSSGGGSRDCPPNGGHFETASRSWHCGRQEKATNCRGSGRASEVASLDASHTRGPDVLTTILSPRPTDNGPKVLDQAIPHICGSDTAGVVVPAICLRHSRRVCAGPHLLPLCRSAAQAGSGACPRAIRTYRGTRANFRRSCLPSFESATHGLRPETRSLVPAVRDEDDPRPSVAAADAATIASRDVQAVAQSAANTTASAQQAVATAGVVASSAKHATGSPWRRPLPPPRRSLRVQPPRSRLRLSRELSTLPRRRSGVGDDCRQPSR